MFDPFSSADFSRSQQPEQKYGIAHAFLDAALRCEPANGKLLPTFDIRHGSAKRLVAYWVTVAHRVRCEGSGMLMSLHNQALQDSASTHMLWTLFSTPPSAKDYRRIVAPAKTSASKRRASLRLVSAIECWVTRLTLSLGWPNTVQTAALLRQHGFRQDLVRPTSLRSYCDPAGSRSIGRNRRE